MSRRLRHISLAALVAAAALGLAACGGSSDSGSAGTTTAATTTGHGHDGTTPAASVIYPPAKAPALGLKDSNGATITTAQFEGKPLLVTFVYSHCPDVCPLIVSNFRSTLNRLGPKAKDLQIVAVSVDPEGDTAKGVNEYMKRMRMTGKMHWLLGTRAQLEPVWERWGVATDIPKSNPELVEHAAPIYGVDAGGTIQSLYPPSFRPADVLADFSRLSRAS